MQGLLNGNFGNVAPDPFGTTTFFSEPVAYVLAGHVPQKPYEHDLFFTESLRSSRLVSGNVMGGSEILYSTLLVASRPDVGDDDVVSSDGVHRLNKIR